jgi:DMSO/TMAO reductase YedYZ molybdopterin-dependent catalytic subunit
MARINAADHRKGLERISRRLLLRSGLSLGGLSLLTGCNLDSDDAVDRLLSAISRWNDKVQAALFSRARLAPTYGEADITDPFPFNAYYPLNQVRHVDGDAWRLELSGSIAERRAWSLPELGRRAVPRFSRPHRRGCKRALCGVPLCRWLSRQHRHGDRAA